MIKESSENKRINSIEGKRFSSASSRWWFAGIWCLLTWPIAVRAWLSSATEPVGLAAVSVMAGAGFCWVYWALKVQRKATRTQASKAYFDPVSPHLGQQVDVGIEFDPSMDVRKDDPLELSLGCIEADKSGSSTSHNEVLVLRQMSKAVAAQRGQASFVLPFNATATGRDAGRNTDIAWHFRALHVRSGLDMSWELEVLPPSSSEQLLQSLASGQEQGHALAYALRSGRGLVLEQPDFSDVSPPAALPASAVRIHVEPDHTAYRFDRRGWRGLGIAALLASLVLAWMARGRVEFGWTVFVPFAVGAMVLWLLACHWLSMRTVLQVFAKVLHIRNQSAWRVQSQVMPASVLKSVLLKCTMSSGGTVGETPHVQALVQIEPGAGHKSMLFPAVQHQAIAELLVQHIWAAHAGVGQRFLADDQTAPIEHDWLWRGSTVLGAAVLLAFVLLFNQ